MIKKVSMTFNELDVDELIDLHLSLNGELPEDKFIMFRVVDEETWNPYVILIERENMLNRLCYSIDTAEQAKRKHV